jgi:UrcA family protein
LQLFYLMPKPALAELQKPKETAMKILVIAAIAAAAFASTPTLAQGGSSQVAVSTADLDLSRAEDRARLDLRLFHAARTVCGTASPADAYGSARAADCVADARAAAERQREAILARALPNSGPVLASGR